MKIIKIVLTILVCVSYWAAAYPTSSQAQTYDFVRSTAKSQLLTDSTYDFGLNYILVKYKGDEQIHIRLVEENIEATKQVLSINLGKPAIDIPNIKYNSQLLNTQERQIAKEKLQVKLAEVLSDPNVEIAQPEYFYSASAWQRSGDEDFPNDYNPAAAPLNRHWYYDLAKVPQMWQDQDCLNTGTLCGGDPSVVIAVIDTGVAYEDHTSTYGDDFDAATELTGVNFVNPYNADQDAYCYVRQYIRDNYLGTYPVCNAAELNEINHANDDNGHGTYVTSLIASNVDNGAGVDTGSVAPGFNLSIMPIKANWFHTGVYAQYGVWSGQNQLDNFGSLSVINAVNYARENGADIINMSFGSSTPMDDLVKKAIDDAVNEGLLIIAPTGNNNSNLIQYPAAYTNVLAVGAVNANGSKSSYSNYGNKINLVAYVGDSSDGVLFQESYNCFFSEDENSDQGNICPEASRPTVDAHTEYTTGNNVFDTAVGTSFAPPQVAAAAGIIKSNNPSYKAPQLALALSLSTDDLGAVGFDSQTGYGVLNFEKANNIDLTSTAKYDYAAYRDNLDTKRSWINVGNPETNSEEAKVAVLAVRPNKFSFDIKEIDPGDKDSFNFKSFNGGPVTVYSLPNETSGSVMDVYTSQKTKVDGGLNEMGGTIRSSELGSKFYFTSYRHDGDTRKSWINVVNPNTSLEEAKIKISLYKNGLVADRTLDLNPGEKVSESFDGVNGALVVVESLANDTSASVIDVYASQRVIVGQGFAEIKGILDSTLATKYYYTAYRHDGNTKKSWINVGNPSTNSEEAKVRFTVYHNGTSIQRVVDIEPGQRTSEAFDGVAGGLVVVDSIPNDTSSSIMNVFSSQKTIVDFGFTEILGISPAELTSKFYYTAYRHDGNTKKSWINVGNPETSSEEALVKITVYDNGVPLENQYEIQPGERISVAYNGLEGGPVIVESIPNNTSSTIIDVYSSQKTIVDGGLTEMLGLFSN